MSAPVNVAEAKAKLSSLLDRVSGGEEIVIARAGRPVARLVPLAAPGKRPFGVARHLPEIPDEVLLAPVSGEDLRWATGEFTDALGMSDKKKYPRRKRPHGK